MRVVCPSCSAAFHANDEAAGRRARCSRCGEAFVLTPGAVPAARTHGLTDSPGAPPPPLRTSAAAALLTAPPPSKPFGLDVPDPEAPRPLGETLTDCLASPFRVLRHGKLVVTAVLVGLLGLCGAAMLVGVGAAAAASFDGTPPGTIVLGLSFLPAAAVVLLTTGYFAQALMALVRGTLEDAATIEPPPLQPGRAFVMGLLWLGLTCLYVLPVVTLPLLPLALLALGRTGDLRAADVGWALQAAFLRPGRWFAAVLHALAWLVTAGAGVWALHGLMPSTAELGEFLRLADGEKALLAGRLVGVLIGTTALQVVGLLACAYCGTVVGRDVPEILESIPGEANPGMSVMYIVLAAVVAVFVLVLAGYAM